MKKKSIVISIIVLVIIAFIGIDYFHNNKANGKMLCTNTIDGDSAYIVTKYYVTFKNHNVIKLSSIETIKPKDETLLDSYYSMLKTMYNEYTELNDYKNTIHIKKKVLTSKTSINYSKINKNDLIKIDKSNKNLYTDNDIKINTLRKTYEKTGAICKIK